MMNPNRVDLIGIALAVVVTWSAASALAAAQDVPEPPQNQPASVEPAPAAKESPQAALPPCIPAPPAVRPHHHRRKPLETPQRPEPQTIPQAQEPPKGPDGLIDARVGETASPLASILGKNVQSPKGEDLGRVVDVLADADGRVKAAIIDFGGFLGVGTRRIAIDWPLLQFDPNDHDKPMTLSVSREKLQSVPEYKDSNKPKLLMPPSGAVPPDAADNSNSKK